MIDTSPLRRRLLDLAVTGRLIGGGAAESAECGVRRAECFSRVDRENVERETTDCTDGRARRPRRAALTSQTEREESISRVEHKEHREHAALPPGWRMVRLGEVTRAIGTKQHQVQAREIKQTGACPVVSQGRGLIDGYTDASEKAIAEVPLILFGDHTKNVKYIDFPFVVGADGTKLFIPLDGVDAKWLYYWTLDAVNKIGDRGYGRHWGLLQKLEIPLPPLSEQKEIVRRLEGMLARERGIAEDSAALDALVAAAKRKILQFAVSGKLIGRVDRENGERETTDRTDCTDGRAARPRAAALTTPPERENVFGRVEHKEHREHALPAGWKMVRLGEVVELISGRDLPPNEYFDEMPSQEQPTGGRGRPPLPATVGRGVPDAPTCCPYMTGASNFKNGALLVNRWTASPVVISEAGDLLITCKGSIGELCINRIGKVHIARQIMAFRPTGVNVNYLKLTIESMLGLIKSKAHGVIPGIARADVIDLSFPLPPLAEQNAIVAKVDALFAALDAIKG